MKKNKYVLLLSNAVIFAIGNLLVKLISFFLMPIYTSILTTEQYGVSELINSAVEIILPIGTLCIVEALYRFSIDKEEDPQKLFTSSILIIVCGDFLVILACIILSLVCGYQYSFEFSVLYVTITFYKITTQFARGIGHSKRFALYGVINALILVISNVILLVELHGGVKAYLFSFSIGYGVAGVCAFCLSNEYRYFKLEKIDFDKLKEMFRYGIPDIPNTLSWWVNSVSDRYIVLYFWGASISGLYTAASKLPAIINLVTSIFQQAWQYSAAKEIKSSDSKMFFRNVFRGYTYVCMLLCITLVICNRSICAILLKSDFYAAWKFVPMLLLAATFGCFSSYFGSFYGALKDNVSAMKSTIAGAVVNLILNLLLIPKYGGLGAAVATAVSYGMISLIRFIDLRKKVDIDINNGKITFQIATTLVLVIISMTEYFKLTYFIGVIVFIGVLLSDFELLKLVYDRIISVLVDRK